MSKFKPGKELRGEAGIRNFEFFNDYIKRGLQPYNKNVGKPISPPDIVRKIKSTEKDRSDAVEEYASKTFSMSPAGQKQRRMFKEYNALYYSGRSSRSSRSSDDDEVVEKKDLLEIEKRIKTKEKELSLLKKDFSWKDSSLPESEKEAIKFLDALDGYFYIEEEFLKIAEEHNLPLPDKETEEQPIKEVKKEASQGLSDFKEDPRLTELLKKVKPGMESLFSDLKEYVGFDYDKRTELEKEAINWLNDQDDQIIKNFFKKEYLKDPKIYNTEPKQTPRDFIGALLKKIVKDQIKKKIGGQRLYEVYKEF